MNYNKLNIIIRNLLQCLNIASLAPNNLIYLSEIIASIAHSILSGNNFSENIGYNMIQLLYNIINEVDLNSARISFEEDIRSKKEYRKLKEKYNEYITEIAKLIKSCGNFDIYEIVLLHTLLLRKGIFSKDDIFNFFQFKKDYDHIHGIMGPRIAAGLGVCRNLSSHLKDVLDKLGYENYLIHCATDIYGEEYENDPDLFYYSQDTHHVFNALIKDEEIILYDPTEIIIGSINEKNKYIADFRTIDNYHSKKYAIGISNNSTYWAKKEGIERVSSLPNYINKHSNDKLEEKAAKVQIFVENNMDYFIEWKQNHLELINEISELDHILSQYNLEEMNKSIKFDLEEKQPSRNFKKIR